MKKQALFWQSQKNQTIQCCLCAHHCIISEGKTGICGVRKNEQGTLMSLIYGSCCSMTPDPIEKKPLYHFFPGSMVLSFGSIGCNFSCKHCQNYEISTSQPGTSILKEISPEQAVQSAQEGGCQGIAWTYNEPTIWFEYTFDTAKLAKKNGLYTVYVTNGYIQKKPLKKIAPFLDAMNIDVKAFTDDFYKNICTAHLQPVLETCKYAYALGIHVELTYLVIPGLNDSTREITMFCQWVVDHLGKEVVVHFSRFHPDYKLQEYSATPLDTMMRVYAIAKKCGITYPYVGNVPHGEYENTMCPECGNLCIERRGFHIQESGIKNGVCTQCGSLIPIINSLKNKSKQE